FPPSVCPPKSFFVCHRMWMGPVTSPLRTDTGRQATSGGLVSRNSLPLAPPGTVEISTIPIKSALPNTSWKGIGLTMGGKAANDGKCQSQQRKKPAGTQRIALLLRLFSATTNIIVQPLLYSAD